MMRSVLGLVVVAAIVGVAAPKYLDRFATNPSVSSVLAARASATNPQPSQVSTGYRTVTIGSDSRGHFAVEARIDGRTIGLVVDTGASKVVLRETSAARLGIFPRVSEYTGRATTANGIAKFAPVRLDRIEIDGITVRDVDAAVMPDEALSDNLLGMTFLSRVKWTHDRGRLVLEQ
jgi:aspartyl protease family protein